MPCKKDGHCYYTIRFQIIVFVTIRLKKMSFKLLEKIHDGLNCLQQPQYLYWCNIIIASDALIKYS